MTSATDRRAVLGAVLAAGAVGATTVLPAVASAATTPSAVDRHVLDLWRRLTKLHTICKKLRAADRRKMSESERTLSCKRSDAAVDAMVDVENEIAEHMEASVLALAAIILADLPNRGGYFEEGVYRASLRVIRPQLIGAIAEDTDRVLAEEEEDA